MTSKRPLFAFFAVTISSLFSTAPLPAASASKALSLSNQATKELTKNCPESVETAIALLEQAICDSSFRRQNFDKQLSIYLHLCTAYEKNMQFEKEQKLIQTLLKDKNYSRYFVELKIRLASSFLQQQKIQEADLLLGDLEREPKRRLLHTETASIQNIKKQIEEHFEIMSREAENHFNNTCYAEAKKLFALLFDSVCKRRFPKTRSTQTRQEIEVRIAFGLAASHFALHEFVEAQQIAKTQDKIYLSQIDNAAPFFWKNKRLLAFAYMKTGEFEAAYSAFNHYLKHFPNDREARLEALFCAIKNGDFTNAAYHEVQLEIQLEKQPLSNTHYSKLLTYKTLFAIETNSFVQAAALVEACCERDALFLKGYLMYQQKNYEDAVFFLEKCVPFYRDDSLYLLGICYTELGKTQKELQQQHAFLERAQNCFDEIKQSPLFSWIQKPATPAYLQFCHAKKLYSSDSNQNEQCKKAISRLFEDELKEKTFVKSHPFLLEILHFLLKNEPKICLSLLEHYQKALCLETNVMHIVEECSYLQCLAAGCKKEDIAAFTQRFTDSIYHPELLFYAGLIALEQQQHDQAATYFSQLLQSYQKYPKTDQVYYFYARCIKNPEVIYQKLYETYPDSEYATEAYYRIYPENAYIEGNATALLHLKRMGAHLQKGPFWILASFYIAQNIRQEAPELHHSEVQRNLLKQALNRYETIIYDVETTNSLYKDLPELFDHLNKIAMQSRLESITTKLTLLAQWDESQNSEELEKSYQQCQEGLTSIKALIDQVSNDSSKFYSNLWQESARTAYKTYQVQGKKAEARAELEHLIHYAKNCSLLQTEAVLFSVCELARLHIKEGSYGKAATLLDMAEEIHTHNPQKTFLLQVWIVKSELAEKQKDISGAMKLLSKVINDDSASSLRLEAMFLRGELYEKKGRRDLARKQFTACTKKGGEWANRAKKKLEVEYGYE